MPVLSWTHVAHPVLSLMLLLQAAAIQQRPSNQLGQESRDQKFYLDDHICANISVGLAPVFQLDFSEYTNSVPSDSPKSEPKLYDSG